MSLVIGIGIFRTPAMVADAAGNETLFFSSWIIGGVIAFLGGVVFAEIGSRKPLAGGFYKIVSEAYHPAFAFMLNWVGIIVLSGVTYAAMAILAAEYLSKLISFPVNIKYLACTIIALLFLINYFGIKTGSAVLNFLTFLKIALIVFFIIAAFVFSGSGEQPVNQPISQSTGNLFRGLIAVFFTYSGYQLTMNLNADVKNPKKNLPKGIITGIGISVVLYLLINFGYYKILGLQGIASSPLIAADSFYFLFGDAGKKIISLIIFISAFAFLNVSLMHNQRAFFAMAEDRVIPAFFKSTGDKSQSQKFALAFISLLTVLFVFVYETFENALNLIMFLETMTIAVAASTVFIFRKKNRNENYNGFKISFYPFLPALFILIILIVSANAFLNDIYSGLASIGFFLIGYPVYLFLKKII
jgi:APA family basic amino acid/polyamine antiporter